MRDDVESDANPLEAVDWWRKRCGISNLYLLITAHPSISQSNREKRESYQTPRLLALWLERKEERARLVAWTAHGSHRPNNFWPVWLPAGRRVVA
jgi:hypothetical protein